MYLDIAVRGAKSSYYVRTIIDWLYEIKDIIEDEYSAKVKIRHVEEPSEIPEVYVCGEFAFSGLPDNEGGLIEIIKSVVERKIIKQENINLCSKKEKYGGEKLKEEHVCGYHDAASLNSTKDTSSLEKIVHDIEKMVIDTLGFEPVHGFPHIERVMKIAFKLAEDFKEVNPLVLKLAVLLHDIGRVEEETLRKHHAILSAEMAKKLLVQYGFSQEIIDKVVDAILAHSFTLKYTPKTIEGRILSDADKLDALGAVGIMRVFMESAYRGRTLEEAINHFYEKLFKLKDLMWTEKAKKMAEKRYKFMVYFLDRLEKEIEAEE